MLAIHKIEIEICYGRCFGVCVRACVCVVVFVLLIYLTFQQPLVTDFPIRVSVGVNKLFSFRHFFLANRALLHLWNEIVYACDFKEAYYI